MGSIPSGSASDGSRILNVRDLRGLRVFAIALVLALSIALAPVSSFQATSSAASI